jgi:hypothetical protein
MTAMPRVDGDKLALELSSPSTWKIGIVVMLATAGAAVFARHLFGPDDVATVAWILVMGPMLLFFHQHGLVFDRSAGTLTKYNRLLFFSWKSVVPIQGEAISIERHLHVPEDGESHWVSFVFLGSTKLFMESEAQAQALGDEIAHFLGVSCSQKQVDSAQAMRMAATPIFITLGLTVLLLVVFGIYRLVAS